MKILFIACYSPLINNSASIETLQYLNNLVNEGNDIHLLTVDFPKNSIYYDEYILSMLNPKVKIHTLIGRFTDLIEALTNGQIDIFVGETSILTPRNKYWFVPLKKRVAVYCCRDKHPILKSKSIDHRVVAAYPLITCQLPIRLLPHIKEPNEGLYTEK